MTLLEKWPEKIQALNRIQTRNRCITDEMLHRLSYQSHMRAVMCGFCPLCSLYVLSDDFNLLMKSVKKSFAQ